MPVDKRQRCWDVYEEEELGEKQSSCRGWMTYQKKEQIIWTALCSLFCLLDGVCCEWEHWDN